jgi:ABC-type multidrug transport system permease subunit
MGATRCGRRRTRSVRLALRIFHEDLFLLLQGARGLLLVLVLPPLMLLVVGGFGTDSPTIRLLVAGATAEKLEADHLGESLRRLGEASGLEIDMQKEGALDPMARLQTGRFDLLLNLDDPTSEQPVLYTAVTDPSRLFLLQRLGARVLPALEQMKAGHWKQGMVTLGVVSGGPLVSYYPGAANRSLRLFPFTIAVVISFLPFVLASPSLLREREDNTLEVLLTAPGSTMFWVLAGKCVTPVVVTVTNFVLMLAIAQSAYELPINSRLPALLLFLIPVLLSSTLFGLAVSCLVESQSQVTIASAVYLVALFLLSGQFFEDPLSGQLVADSSSTLRLLSRLFPLPFLRSILNSWCFGAGLGPEVFLSLVWLALQVLLYGAFCAWAFRRLRLAL